MQIPSTPINTGFRALFLGLSLMAIVITLLKYEKLKLNKAFVFFLVFWFIYSIRLIYDLEIEGHRYLDNTKEWTYLFAFGGCLIPSIALFFSASNINPDKIVTLIFYIVLFSNICILVDVLYLAKGNLESVFLQRASLNIGKNIDGLKKSQSAINPITISFTGQILALFSLALLIIDKYRINRFAVYFALVLGLLNLTLGASRGPFLSFVLITLLIVFTKYKTVKNSTLFNLKLFTWFSFFSILISLYLIPNFKKLEISLFNRILVSMGIKSDPYYKGEERFSEYESAWQQFIDNPIWGDKFVDNALNSYPHNFILEVLMATGIIGAVPFIIMIFYLLKKVYVLYSRIHIERWAIHYIIMTLSILISFLLSGGLFVGVVFWSCISFILAMKIEDTKEVAV